MFKPSVQLPKDVQRYSTRRLEALSDGVFAIAMTILVLDLNVEELGQVRTDHQLWEALQAIQVDVVSFLISFLLLGAMWAVHVRQFEYIKESDRHFTFINTLRLLMVVLIPFTTNLSSEYPDLMLGRVLFPLNFFGLALITYWQWYYATSEKRVLYDAARVSKAEIRRGRQRSMIVLLTAAAVVVTSIFVGQAAFSLFLIWPLVTLVQANRSSTS